ncbi:MAG: hypothetical protein V4726_24080 [Verrucomicrobiota bacterium]
MKKLLLSLSLVSGITLFSGSLMAAPLQRTQVSADAKWLVHLDMDALRKSTFGSTILQFALTQAGDTLKREMKIDLPALVAQTGSITVYGNDFKPGLNGPNGRGVLIFQGSKAVEQVVSGILIQQAEAAKAGQGSVKALSEGLDPVYSVMPNLFVAVRPGQGILVSPKPDQIEEACRIIEGKAPSLEGTTTFSEYATLPGGFFFLALAEGFARDAGLPPQAQVLKLAEGGRIALGESTDKLQLSVSLKAQTTEGAVQIQQVVQGLIALASLADVDEPELIEVKKWVGGAKVDAKEKLVSLNLAVPVAAALKQLSAAADVEINIPSGKETSPAPATPPVPAPVPAIEPAR